MDLTYLWYVSYSLIGSKYVLNGKVQSPADRPHIVHLGKKPCFYDLGHCLWLGSAKICRFWTQKWPSWSACWVHHCLNGERWVERASRKSSSFFHWYLVSLLFFFQRLSLIAMTIQRQLQFSDGLGPRRHWDQPQDPMGLWEPTKYPQKLKTLRFFQKQCSVIHLL